MIIIYFELIIATGDDISFPSDSFDNGIGSKVFAASFDSFMRKLAE